MAPQSNHVLLCLHCKAFQVHLVKKAKKWECKICGTKQTLTREFGSGNGAECRQICQKLNEARGKLENLQPAVGIVGEEQEQFEEQLEEEFEKGFEPKELKEQEFEEHEQTLEPALKKSKWAVFVNDDEHNLLN